LKQNLNHLDNVTLINAAIWHKKTKLQISDKFNSGKWGIVTEEIEKIEDEGSMIDAISIDEILKENQIENIDILKIDIECAEKYLFSNNYLSWLPKTKMVIIELHEHLCSGCSQPFFEAIGKSFKNYSYHIRCENTMIVNRDLSL
jgi:FkbM family methyltransferase